jgi:hypothetical protein
MMIKKLLPLLFLFAGFQVNAAIITDDNVYDDGNLEWLNLSFTRNMSSADALVDFGGDGFRMASVSEAAALIDGWFGVSMTGAVLRGADPELVHEFLDLFGVTFYSRHSFGILEDGGMFGVSAKFDRVFSGAFHRGYNYGAGGVASERAGYWMVRDSAVSGDMVVRVGVVPEPSIIALFGLGLVSMGFARRRQP